MRLTIRQSDIIRCIYNSSELSIRQIAAAVGVTSMTVRNEIIAMKEFFKNYGIDIRISEKSQLKLLGREKLSRLVRDAKVHSEFTVSNQILLVVVLHPGYLTIQEIADLLFVSKSLVDKQLPAVLKKYGGQIESMRHYGIRYRQDELRRRMAFVDLLKHYMTGNNLEQELMQFHQNQFAVMHYFTAVQLQKAAAMMDIILKEEQVTFADDAVCQLYLYFLITLYRNHQDETVSESSPMRQSVLRPDSRREYRMLIDRLTPQMNSRYQEDESKFLQFLFWGLRKHKSPGKEEIVREMAPLLQEIFQKIKVVLLFDLYDHPHLLEGLATHIYTAVLRNIPNDEYDTGQWDIQEFRRQYPIGIEMASIAAEIIAKRFHCTVGDEDLLYLAFHFQSAVEGISAKNQKVRAVIICHYNIAAANLIRERIRRRFSEIEIIGIYSLQEFKNCSLSKIDLILTTDQISGMQAEVIYVTPMLKEAEMQGIAKFVEKKKISETMIVKIQEAKIICLTQIMDKESAIIKCAAYLEENGYVAAEFLKSVLERERISSTNLKYIAVPHGNPQFVYEPKLVILRLEKPVIWGGSEVSSVFLFAYHNKMLAENPLFMGNFYRNLAKPAVEEQIRSLEGNDQNFKRELLEILI